MNIKPTIGRVVWYTPAPYETDITTLDDQPCVGHVTFVHTDTMVNLDVIDHVGKHHALPSIVLADCYSKSQPGEAEWMPYQKSQAEKHKSETSS